LTGGKLFAIDGCEPPSNAAKEWSGTLEELKKKKKDLEGLMGKIIAQHIQFDARAAVEKDLSGAAFSCVYDKECQDKHLERTEKKFKYINTFLESAKIAGPRGYIQGYNGIAIADAKSQIIVAAEAFGSGNGSEMFPAMMNVLAETMGTLSGK
jgi:hypothetical protein